MNIVVLINGMAGVGKDTFIEYCDKNCVYPKFKFHNFSTVSIYKKIAKLIGCDYNKSVEDRKFISDLKNLSKAYNNFSVINTGEFVNNIIKNSPKGQINIFFIHTREIPEIKEFCEYFEKYLKVNKCITLLIKRNIVQIELDVEKNVELDEFKYDYNFMLENFQDTIDHVDFFLKILKQISQGD